MDCYFHSNVPSVAPCSDCGKAICATCRDDRGTCPSCRLAEKIDATAGPRPHLEGQVPPRGNRYAGAGATYAPPPPPSAPQTQARATVSTISDDPVESRALVALGYPLWPLALLSLLDRKSSRYLKKQALQALGFNVGMAAFWGLLQLASQIPVLGFSPWLLTPFMIPVFLVASVFFGIKVWHGEDVRVPIIGDWIEERLPA